MYCSWKMRIAGSKISSLPVHFLLTVTTFVSQLFKIRQDFSPLLILICGEEFNMLNSYFYTYLVFTRCQIDLFEKQPAFAFSTFQRLNFQFQERFSYHPERDYIIGPQIREFSDYNLEQFQVSYAELRLFPLQICILLGGLPVLLKQFCILIL